MTATHHVENEAPLYIIPTLDAEKKRLSLQHTVIVRQFGWHLHPSIRVKPEDEVLEVATGTGIWALEFAKMSPPSLKIEACDINTTYFPAPKDIPQNVHFSEQSVLALPQAWTNKFNIVHQRLLICGLSTDNWRTALQELYRVTKPGGWIQLIEIDAQGKQANYGPAAKKFLIWLKALMNQIGLVYDAVDHVLEHIKAAGFVNYFQEPKQFWIESHEAEVCEARAVWRGGV
jgi:ubiquinone/menaquinone biosynthesis C-methylase UbiE